MSLKELAQAESIETFELKLIREFYGLKTAKRSGVLLMNHIMEGLDMLTNMGATTFAKRAYCLHPIIQHQDDYDANYSTLERHVKNGDIDNRVLKLAVTYRNKANAYLCRPKTDHFTIKDLEEVVGYCSPNMIHMLAADKLQNEKDFELYHKGKHIRSEQLAHYFDLWLKYLDHIDLTYTPNLMEKHNG